MAEAVEEAPRRSRAWPYMMTFEEVRKITTELAVIQEQLKAIAAITSTVASLEIRVRNLETWQARTSGQVGSWGSVAHYVVTFIFGLACAGAGAGLKAWFGT